MRGCLIDLTVSWYFLNCTFSYGDTLKLIQFFCLISSLCCSALFVTYSSVKRRSHFLDTCLICMLRHRLWYFILAWSWCLCLVVARYFLKVPCLGRDVDGEMSINITKKTRNFQNISDNCKTIKLSIAAYALTFRCRSKKCDLCLRKKFVIARADQKNFLSRKTKLISKCCHRNKCILKK